MSRQEINKNQNITFPTISRPLDAGKSNTPPKGRTASEKLEERKESRADSFEEDAKISAQTSYDTENQLSSNLITVTLAFVALISVAISSSDLITMMNTAQKWLIMSALVIFCISILAGLINYFYNMRQHQKNSRINDRIARRVDNAKSEQELEHLGSVEISTLTNGQARKTTFLLAQIIMMCVGLAMTVVFVGTLLFSV